MGIILGLIMTAQNGSLPIENRVAALHEASRLVATLPVRPAGQANAASATVGKPQATTTPPGSNKLVPAQPNYDTKDGCSYTRSLLKMRVKTACI